MILGIDASRGRSGGAVAHLVGILSESDPIKFGITEIHVWSYRALLDKLPERGWLIKHNPPELERSLFRQIWWQRYLLPAQFSRLQCDALLNIDAGTFTSIKSCITMSRDMLSFEPGEIQRYGFSIARIRLWLLRYLQLNSLKTSAGAIFLTQHAHKVISEIGGEILNSTVIPHGLNEFFRGKSYERNYESVNLNSIRLIYVSNTAWYKHQWNVVRAVALLRKKLNLDLSIKLIGGGSGKPQKMLTKTVNEVDSHRRFVNLVDFIPHSSILEEIERADIFIFASSCENMPNTLLEGMATGIPIACSNRGPMPEVLQDAGVYFDPENVESIAHAIQSLMSNPEEVKMLGVRAQELSRQYTWERTGNSTWQFFLDTFG